MRIEKSTNVYTTKGGELGTALKCSSVKFVIPAFYKNASAFRIKLL